MIGARAATPWAAFVARAPVPGMPAGVLGKYTREALGVIDGTPHKTSKAQRRAGPGRVERAIDVGVAPRGLRVDINTYQSSVRRRPAVDVSGRKQRGRYGLADWR